MEEKKRDSFGSRIGFILSAAGFSIGLGNVWRFPYLTSKFGGGAFVLAYVLICIFVGLPLFLGELSIGRRMKATPIVGFLKEKKPFWSLIGWVGAVACIILMAYYTVIIGWMVRYAVKALGGVFTGSTFEQTEAMFNDFMQKPFELIAYTVVVFAALGLAISRGVKEGVEKLCKWLLPILGVMILTLAIRSLTLSPVEGVGKVPMDGLKWYLSPDFSQLSNPEVWLYALGQSFFSIGVGIATAVVYGSYRNDTDNMPKDAAMVVTMDTTFALIAGVVIFPALLVYGADPNASGVGLVMEVMPVVFGKMPMGSFWASLFFMLVAVAGYTSGLGYLEAPVACFADLFKVKRSKMTWIVVFIMFVLSLPCVYSLSAGHGWMSGCRILGKSIFDFADYLSGNVMMPVDALLVSLYISFVLKFSGYMEESNKGLNETHSWRVTNWWMPWVTYGLPVVLIVIMYRNVF